MAFPEKNMWLYEKLKRTDPRLVVLTQVMGIGDVAETAGFRVFCLKDVRPTFCPPPASPPPSGGPV